MKPEEKRGAEGEKLVEIGDEMGLRSEQKQNTGTEKKSWARTRTRESECAVDGEKERGKVLGGRGYLCLRLELGRQWEREKMRRLGTRGEEEKRKDGAVASRVLAGIAKHPDFKPPLLGQFQCDPHEIWTRFHASCVDYGRFSSKEMHEMLMFW